MKKTKIRINQRRFFLNILLPTFLTFGLFIILIFSFIIPYFEQSMLDSKKEMTKELVNACAGIAAKFELEARSGLITQEEAKQAAISRIKHLRYGINNKDYFWITDLQPVMIMHPYRSDLNGQNLTGFKDPEGKALFVEMVAVVKKDGAGYVDYMWQWMDDSTRIVPKISYVSEFKPWGWVIGTGVYIEDVRTEIAAIISRLVVISLGISIIMVILLFIIVRNNLKAERKRNAAEDDLKESRERYKALVEASDEGTLMILNGRCVYSNNQARDIFELEDFGSISNNLREIIHPSCSGDMEKIRQIATGGESYLQIETLLVDKPGNAVPALLSLSAIDIDGEKGLIIIIKDLRTGKANDQLSGLRSSPLWLLAENLGFGAFRAQPGRKGRFIKANMQAAKILGFASRDEMLQHNILDLVEDSGEKVRFLRAVAKQGSVKDFKLHIKKPDGTFAEVLVTATLINNEDSGLPYSEGFFEDQTERITREDIRNNIMADLQAMSQLDSAPAKSIAMTINTCPPEIAASEAIRLMNNYQRGSLLVKTAGETFVGIITDKVLREKSSEILQNPKLIAADIMVSPIPWIDETASICHAFRLLQKAGLGAVTIKNQLGIISGLIQSEDFVAINLNPVNYMIGAIEKAASFIELKKVYDKLPVYIKVMVQSGAKTSSITKLVTEVSDNITQKIATLLVQELGEPPIPFAFICMGSQGRGEQTLVTDQDNAIIYADSPENNKPEVKAYFLMFGEKMNRMLADTAYELCKGGVMAGNPKWNQPLTVWNKYFSDWIMTPEPQNILDTGIFFDFKCVYGKESLAAELRNSINQNLARHPAFFGQMAKVCINYKIPLGMFGKIQTESKENQENSINLKNAIRVIVNIVRLYAMQQQSLKTGTPDRMLELFAKNVISSALHADLIYAFEYLSMLQFRNQARQYGDLQPMDNYIDLATLPGIETEMLKAVFSKLASFQSKIKYDFGISGN